MKSKKFIFISLFTILIMISIACSMLESPTAKPQPTATPQPTDAPQPASPQESAPASTGIPVGLEKIYSGISPVLSDNFEYKADRTSPVNWTDEDDQNALQITKNNILQIQTTSGSNAYGTVFYYNKQVIQPNSGIYVNFRYSGTAGDFTLGMDVVGSDGKLIPNGKNNNYATFAMVMHGITAYPHSIFNGVEKQDNFQGALNFTQNNWYAFTVARDDKDTYLVKIWSLDDPGKSISYEHTFNSSPDTYRFISWTPRGQVIQLKNFVMFNFDSFLQKAPAPENPTPAPAGPTAPPQTPAAQSSSSDHAPLGVNRADMIKYFNGLNFVFQNPTTQNGVEMVTGYHKTLCINQDCAAITLFGPADNLLAIAMAVPTDPNDINQTSDAVPLLGMLAYKITNDQDFTIQMAKEITNAVMGKTALDKKYNVNGFIVSESVKPNKDHYVAAVEINK